MPQYLCRITEISYRSRNLITNDTKQEMQNADDDGGGGGGNNIKNNFQNCKKS